MFLSNPAKSFPAYILLLLATTGCGFLQTSENKQPTQLPVIKSRVPFATKEPENFQCEIVVTTGETTRRTRLARIGSRRRIDFDFGERNQRAVLNNDKEYLIGADDKIYAEKTAKVGAASTDAQFSELTSELLNRGERAQFEEIGREQSIIRYKVRLEDGKSNEIIIYFDELIGMPVKQEFFALNGEERTLQYAVELLNFRTDVDESLFAIPAEFQKVSLNDFYDSSRKR